MAAILVVVAGGATALVAVRPWWIGPRRPAVAIGVDFFHLERWASVAAIPPRHSDALAGAAALLAGKGSRIPDAQIPTLKDAEILPEERAALEALVRWHSEKGDFRSLHCRALEGDAAAAAGAPVPPTGAPPSAVPLESYQVLGAVALATSRGVPEDRSRAEAAIALADSLRARGTFEEHRVGVRLALSTARWVAARKYKITAAFEAHRPRLEQLRASLARSAVCAVGELGEDGGIAFLGWDVAPSTEARPPLGLYSPGRERLVVMEYFGDWLASTRDAKEAKDLIDWLSEHPPPKSFALAAILPEAGELAAVAEDFAEYNRLLPRAKATQDRSKRRPRRPPRPRATSAPSAPPSAPQ